MRIFISGASGFVGGAVLRRLAKTHEFTAMSRSAKSDAKITALGARPVRCDLGDVASAHMEGAAVVIHGAAFVEQWGPRDAWDRINVDGTKRMLKAAKDAGVKRFVHIGTEAAVVHGQHIRDADESLPLAVNSPYPYCRTKALAEQAVRAANAPGFETIILRPRLIWGPGDQTFLPLLRSMAESGKWVWINHGRALSSTVYIENFVDAIELALTRGRPGEAYYILDEGARTMHAVLGGMAKAVGVTLPERSIPHWVGDLIGAGCEGVWRTFGLKGDPPVTRHAAMVMACDCTLRGDKAKADLGYVPKISFEAGLAQLRQLQGQSGQSQ